MLVETILCESCGLYHYQSQEDKNKCIYCVDVEKYLESDIE